MASLLKKASISSIIPGSEVTGTSSILNPGGFKSKPKKPGKSQQELAAEKRSRSLLDDEIEESESRFKALANRRLGNASLLTGAPRSSSEAAGGSRSSGGRVAGGLSLLGGGGNPLTGRTTAKNSANPRGVR